MDNTVTGVVNPTNSWIKGNVQEYMADYEDHPKFGVLYPYNTSVGIYRCPASKAFLQGVGRGAIVPHNRSYAVSVWLGSNPTLDPLGRIAQRQSDVRNPSETSVFIEENQISIDNAMDSCARGSHGLESSANWHNNAGLLIFDGHSSLIKWKGSRCANSTPNTRPTTPARNARRWAPTRCTASRGTRGTWTTSLWDAPRPGCDGAGSLPLTAAANRVEQGKRTLTGCLVSGTAAVRTTFLNGTASRIS